MTYSTSVLLTDATVYSCPLALAQTVVDEYLFLVQGFSLTLASRVLFFRLHIHVDVYYVHVSTYARTVYVNFFAMNNWI